MSEDCVVCGGPHDENKPHCHVSAEWDEERAAVERWYARTLAGAAAAPSERLAEDEIAAVAAFYEYGATRGNHTGPEPLGPPPGPLTPHIDAMGRAMRKVRAAAVPPAAAQPRTAMTDVGPLARYARPEPQEPAAAQPGERERVLEEAAKIVDDVADGERYGALLLKGRERHFGLSTEGALRRAARYIRERAATPDKGEAQ